MSAIQEPAKTDPRTSPLRRWVDRLTGVGSSLVLHLLLIGGLVFLTYEIPVPPKVIPLEAALPEEDVVMTDLPDNIEVTDLAGTVGTSPTVDLASSATGAMQAASAASPSPATDVAPLTRLDMEAPSRPLASAPSEIGLTEVVPGLMGQTVDAGGLEGSVDRITREIIRQLNQGPVLVVWVMDSTESLKETREKVVERFDRVNSQLAELGKMREDLLLSSVVSFGQGVEFVTDKPVSDPAELQSAVRSIGEDGSGEERIFSAIREAAQKYRRFQTQQKRSVMMIVVTDEIGDDLASIDDCAQIVRRNKIPVYVLGPSAPFGRKTVNILWTDKPTGEVFSVPINRGPESVLPEYLPLPFWGGPMRGPLFASGYGPYGLSFLSRMSGGLYFLFDDNRLPGQNFDRSAMARYAPDYLSLDDYSKQLAKHPLRRAIVEFVRANEETPIGPQFDFLAENLNRQLSDAQKNVAALAHVVDQGLLALEPLSKEREKEPSLRWQAHYDLLLGRLLSTRVRNNEYNWALALMKVNPKPTQGKNNRWRLLPDQEIRFGQSDVAKGAKAKKEAKANEEAKADAARARAILEKVVQAHAGTPWAMLAQAELNLPMGFQWEDYFDDPRPSNPSTNDPKRRQEAEKRIPKF
ncbi:VWA domain-containing protein [bacterium]|nr:VWA domain-containing protein [bacterium]